MVQRNNIFAPSSIGGEVFCFLGGSQELKIDMVITHHPVIFSPVKKITDSTWQQNILLDCIKNNIAVYSAHTNLDIVLGGVNDVLANKFGLQNAEVLIKNSSEDIGLGRIGLLSAPMELACFSTLVKQALNINVVAVGNAGKKVYKVALCGGSGSEFIAEAIKQGADTYVTGDVKYNAIQKAVFSGMNIIGATHQGTEIQIIKKIA